MQSKKTELSYIDILQQSLEKKIKVLDKIIEANKEHAKIAEAEKFEPEAFDEVFDRKDALIKELEQLDRGFNTIYARVRDELTENKEAYKEQIAKMQHLISEITDKSVLIQVEEKRNKETLMGRFDMMKREVHQAKNTQKIAANYYKNMSGLNVVEPQFMDRKK